MTVEMGSTAHIEVLIAKRVTQVVKAFTTTLVSSLQIATPKDTSFASIGWVPSLGKASKSKPGTPLSLDPSRSQAGLARVLASSNPGQVFVTNNVPYIRKLDKGHSSQAQSGYVRRAVVNAVSIIRRGL